MFYLDRHVTHETASQCATRIGRRCLLADLTDGGHLYPAVCEIGEKFEVVLQFFRRKQTADSELPPVYHDQHKRDESHAHQQISSSRPELPGGIT